MDLRTKIGQRTLESVFFAWWSEKMWQLLRTKDQSVSIGIFVKSCAGYTYVLILAKVKSLLA